MEREISSQWVQVSRVGKLATEFSAPTISNGMTGNFLPMLSFMLWVGRWTECWLNS